MSYRNNQTGFTLVELLVVMIVVGILFTSFSSFFTNYLTLYSKYQEDSSNFTELASQSQRVAEVLRGVTDFVSVGNNDLTAYTYFSPGDTFTSQIRYYLNPARTSLMADVIPMTANPPVGTLITANTKTYTIIENFYQPSGGRLFVYYDVAGNSLTVPIANQRTINKVQINLASPASHNPDGQELSITVSLRNRKTNL